MLMRKEGWFPFYTTRNNNFSNRQNTGIICVGGNCPVESGTNTLQDQNPAITGKSMTRNAFRTCEDTLNQDSQANANGATSCLTTASGDSIVLTGETFTVQQFDNDALGTGNENGCTVLFFDGTINTVEEKVILAVVLLFVGLFTSWLAYYLYNRYMAKFQGEGKLASMRLHVTAPNST